LLLSKQISQPGLLLAVIALGSVNLPSIVTTFEPDFARADLSLRKVAYSPAWIR
jgi:hypothetical protein